MNNIFATPAQTLRSAIWEYPVKIFIHLSVLQTSLIPLWVGVYSQSTFTPSNSSLCWEIHSQPSHSAWCNTDSGALSIWCTANWAFQARQWLCKGTSWSRGVLRQILLLSFCRATSSTRSNCSPCLTALGSQNTLLGKKVCLSQEAAGIREFWNLGAAEVQISVKYCTGRPLFGTGWSANGGIVCLECP